MRKSHLVRGCPICGKMPEIEGRGSFIDIDCHVSMSFSKSDYLTYEQRKTFNTKTLRYSPEAEEIALTAILSIWNTRAEDPSVTWLYDPNDDPPELLYHSQDCDSSHLLFGDCTCRDNPDE